MLRIAVPNKGMLSEPAWNMLAEAGYRLRTNPRQLVVQDEDNGIELFYLRPLDIAVYVGRGAIDVGITGQDLLKNSGTAALEHMPLGFGSSTFRFAARTNPRSPLWKTFRASAWPPPSTSWCMTTSSNTVSKLKPSTWTAPWSLPCSWAWPTLSPTWSPPVPRCATPVCAFFRPADALRSMPDSLSASGREGLPSRRTHPPSARRADRTPVRAYGLRHPRKQGVCSRGRDPGFESPTISPLHDKQWNAVRVMVPKAEVNQLMDDLYEVGARGIIVTALQASRM